MDVFPKWIIEGNSLVIRKATYHKDIAENVKNVKGGGWFIFDDAKDAFILYNKSEDFGRCSKEIVHDAISRGNVGRFLNDDRYKHYKIYFSSSDSIEIALNDAIELVPYEIEHLDVEEAKEEYNYLSYDTEKPKEWGYKKFKTNQPIVNESKIGRNELCRCHSGKKYKKCCLK